jgi:hypothetical protein
MPDRLLELISSEQNAISALKAVRDAGPCGAYIAAGFIRNRYWDSLYGQQESRPDVDIDVVYFDTSDVSKTSERDFETRLETLLPTGIWQVRNQARMHVFGNHLPFGDLEDALPHWSETATAVGLRMRENEELEVIAPFGLDDLYGHTLRITPSMKQHDPEGFDIRLAAKGWRERWPDLTVIGAN